MEKMESTVLSSDASLAIRQRFLDIFTDKTGKGYQKSLRLYPYPEGMRCTGYIWEFLSPCAVIHSSDAIEKLSRKNGIYFVQDMRRFNDEHRFKNAFPRDRIVEASGAALALYLCDRQNFPPEMNIYIYIFDSSYDWHITITNEYEKHVFDGDSEPTYDYICMTSR